MTQERTLFLFNGLEFLRINKESLFVSRVNVGCGPAEERLLLTGLHAVADIYCENCHTTLGWKYVSAPTCKLCTHRKWVATNPVMQIKPWVWIS